MELSSAPIDSNFLVSVILGSLKYSRSNIDIGKFLHGLNLCAFPHPDRLINNICGFTIRKLMTHKYRGSQQSSREVKSKFIDSAQGEPKNIYEP